MKVLSGGHLALLGRYLGPRWRRVLALAALLLVSIILQLSGPQILRYFIDTATGGHAVQLAFVTPSLAVAALLYLGIALAGQAVALVEAYVAENLAWSATNQMRADLTLHCLRLDIGFHKAHTPGELIERLDGDVSLLANFFSRFVVQMLGNAVLLVGVLILLFRVDWRVGVTFTCFAVLAFAALSRVQGLAGPRWAAARQSSAELFGFLEERLSGTEDIRSAGATTYSIRRLLERMRDLLRKERVAELMSSAAGNTMNVMLMLAMAAAFVLGALLYRSGAITLGAVYLILNYTQLLRRPIDQINRQAQDFQQAAAGMTRIRRLLDTPSAVREPMAGEQRGGGAEEQGSRSKPGSEGQMPKRMQRFRLLGRSSRTESPLLPGPSAPLLPSGALSVELDHVTFGYANDEAILDGLSLSLPAGKVLGVLGRTGSGKTTITRLLFRLHDPHAGVVRLGDVDVRDVPLTELSERIGMITQEVQLFHATVRDNLTFFDRSVADERILSVLDDLGLTTWYRALPRGLDTRLAGGGGGLSAGEAQLLAFARVFLKDPGLVILDEATSRLDPATERLLERAVDKLLRGRTGIIVAHRLATVQRADDILILEDGRAVEQGARERLARDPESRFNELAAISNQPSAGRTP